MLVALAVITLVICVFALPEMWRGGSEEFPAASQSVSVIVIGLYLTAIPFLVALWQAFKLLRYIKENRAFSDSSVTALQVSKRCWITISALYLGGIPLLFPIAQADDAPGLILFGVAIALAPVTVAVFAAVLERLMKSGMDLKSENDLTV